MANIKSQEKRIGIAEKRNAKNASEKSRVKTAVKKVEEAVANKDKEAASSALKAAIGELDRLAQKGVITANSANRKKAHLEHIVASL